jgi:hypothetical protein
MNADDRIYALDLMPEDAEDEFIDGPADAESEADDADDADDEDEEDFDDEDEEDDEEREDDE